MGRDTTFSNMCRTCMSTSKAMEQQYIHEKPSDGGTDCPTIKEILLSVQPKIKIKIKDKLPKVMCRRCIQQLQMAYNFLQMFKNTDVKFQKLSNGGEPTAPRRRRHIPDNIYQKNCDPCEATTSITSKKKNHIPKLENKSSSLEITNTVQKIDSPSPVDDAWKGDDDFSDDPYNDTSESDWTLEDKKSKKKSLNENKVENKKGPIGENDEKILPPANENGSISCQECDSVLDNASLWREHMQKEHKSNEKAKIIKPKDNFICEYCAKALPTNTKLVQHVRTHTGEEPFLCLECGKGFKVKNCLKVHMMRHRGEKKVQCPHCPKRFVCSGGLKNHMMSHKKEKKFICDICGKAFHMAYMLKNHKIFHAGNKDFPCEYCDQRFATLVRQRRHTLKHTGEKPYRCQYCDRGFTQSNDCNRHLKQHLGKNIFLCELCPMRFPLARDLRVHFATHKDDDEETRIRNLKAREEAEKNLKITLELKVVQAE